MFSSLLLAREVTILGASSMEVLGTFRVRPPRTREAVACIEACRVMEEDDTLEVGFDLLSLALRHWLPLRLSSLLLSRYFSPLEAQRVSVYLLSLGVPDQMLERYQKQAQETTRAAHELGWDRLLAEVASVYGGEPLDWPWGVFCSRIEMLDAMRARYELSVALAVGAGAWGKGFDLIRKRLGDNDAEGMDEKEQIEKLNRYKLMFAGAGLGVA